MFSENNKISSRQIKYIVWMESLAKLCLLFPAYLAGKSLGSVVVCVVLGLLFALWFSGLVVRWSRGRDFFTCVAEASCRPCAILVYVAGFLYFMASGAVFLSLGAEAAHTYLLPEVPVPVLVFPLFGAGLYLCLQGIEVRGRFCEVAGPVVAVLAALLVFASGFGMDAYQYETTQAAAADHLISGAYDVFACLGSVFLPLLTVTAGRFPDGSEGGGRFDTGGPAFSGAARDGRMTGAAGDFCGGRRAAEAARENGVVRAVRRGIRGSVVTAGCLTAVTVASYGKNSVPRMSLPAIRVMSNVTIPGGFFRRWEVLFLVLLLFSLTASVAGAFWYMRVICARLFGEGGKWRENQEEYWFDRDAREPSGDPSPQGMGRQDFVSMWGDFTSCDFTWLFSLLVVWLAASGFLDAVCAVGYYRGLNLYFLLPLLIFFYLIVFLRGKKRRLPLTLLAAVICLGLSGCTARELEERLFPMALEAGVEEERLVLTYAWNEGSGPGSKQEPGESGEEKQGAEETGEKEQEAASPGAEENLTVFRDRALAGIREQALEYTGQYVDYSHVKAVILDESLEQYPELAKELLEWMEEEPEFATSLIIYPAQRSGLSLAAVSGRARGRIGSYLENLYKNDERYRKTALTLGEVLARYYR